MSTMLFVPLDWLAGYLTTADKQQDEARVHCCGVNGLITPKGRSHELHCLNNGCLGGIAVVDMGEAHLKAYATRSTRHDNRLPGDRPSRGGSHGRLTAGAPASDGPHRASGSTAMHDPLLPQHSLAVRPVSTPIEHRNAKVAAFRLPFLD